MALRTFEGHLHQAFLTLLLPVRVTGQWGAQAYINSPFTGIPGSFGYFGSNFGLLAASGGSLYMSHLL